MPRTVQITVPPSKTAALVDTLSRIDGLVGMRVQPGISVQPPGDVISLEVLNRGMPPLMRLLDDQGIGRTPEGSVTTSEPNSIVSSSMAGRIVRDVSESPWEEIEQVIGKESNMTTNALLVMAIAGVVAAVGIATGALHIVIAAMVIAPGFEPISRIALGVIGRSPAWRRGLADTALAYVALAAGAAATTLLLRALDQVPLGGESSYLPSAALVGYWSSISATSLLVSTVAAVAGAVLLATNRSVLTSGVMIALALVPSATITAMALVDGRFGLAAQALERWLVEVALVGLLSAAVFLWKRRGVHQRDLMF